ncbi:MAG: hypothetical protein MSH24_05110, partial [Lachnospiraceae bacterium]|nr:hypothetical protein [Lachnospiraceae bacterium]
MHFFKIKRILTAALLSATVFSAVVFSVSPAMATNNTDTESDRSSDTSDSSGEISWPKGPKVNSKSAVLMDVDSGTVLYSKKPNAKHYPASITKIMTAMVALEHSSLDETVTYSKDAVAQSYGGTSSISRDIGEKMTMEESL